MESSSPLRGPSSRKRGEGRSRWRVPRRFAALLPASGEKGRWRSRVPRPATRGEGGRRPGEGMKITLISPKGPLYRHRGGIFRKSLRYQPLTLTTLAALIPPEIDAEVKLYDEGIEDVPAQLDADIIGMTVITGTSKRAYELAVADRAHRKKIVLGGPLGI